MKLLIQAALFICLPYIITASCMFMRGYTTQSRGTPFCVYEVRSDLQFLRVGENYLDTNNCMNCTCYEEMLDCCGYGKAAGVMMNIPQCKRKMIDNCNFRLVRVDNENESCFGK